MNHTHVKALHPPIDAILLEKLQIINFADKGKTWRKLKNARWSKFDSVIYIEATSEIRQSLLPDEPIWMIEKYGQGYQ